MSTRPRDAGLYLGGSFHPRATSNCRLLVTMPVSSVVLDMPSHVANIQFKKNFGGPIYFRKPGVSVANLLAKTAWAKILSEVG
jgi:hypothetical protein